MRDVDALNRFYNGLIRDYEGTVHKNQHSNVKARPAI